MAGLCEDPDFDHRFRRDALRRWARGFRNGMDLWSLLRFRLGLTEEIRFHGIPVQQSDNQATYRLIHDIWMRGEYDLEGFIPCSGWHVVEIGANVGIYAMLAASRGARVTAYEPTPDAFMRLVANTRAWSVECHNAAVVGPSRGEVRLFLHQLRDTRNTLLGASGGARNMAASEGSVHVAFQHSVCVPSVPISAVLQRPCDLLKIACEGAEFEIIAHAADVLSNARRIMIELHSEMTTDYGGADELIATIRRAGFDVQVRQPLAGMSRRILTAQQPVEG
jgi:FkbM family methyltransferase